MVKSPSTQSRDPPSKRPSPSRKSRRLPALPRHPREESPRCSLTKGIGTWGLGFAPGVSRLRFRAGIGVCAR